MNEQSHISYAQRLEELKWIMDEIRSKYFREAGIPPEIMSIYLQMIETCLKLEKFLENDGGIQRL